MQTRNSIEDVWGPRSPYFGEASWPAREDERTAEEPDRWVQSCCVLRFLAKYAVRDEQEPWELRQALFPKRRSGSFGLLRDLHALQVLASDAHVSTKIVRDVARELRDDALHELCLHLYGQNQRQQAWVDTIIKESAAQSVVVPS